MLEPMPPQEHDLVEMAVAESISWVLRVLITLKWPGTLRVPF